MTNGESPVLYGDGTQMRDFTHVSDIVRGLEVAADERLDGIYNLGTGESYSFNTTDIEPEYVENPIPEDVYVHDTMANLSMMGDATWWEPEISFEEGIEQVCSQYQSTSSAM